MPSRYYKDEKYLKKFGANLKRIRKEHGISQEKLANELGFGQTYITKVEAGTVNPSISHIVAIARHLKVSISLLADV